MGRLPRLNRIMIRVAPVLLAAVILAGLAAEARAAGARVDAALWERLDSGQASQVVMVLLRTPEPQVYAANLAQPARRAQARAQVARVQDQVLGQVANQGVKLRVRYENLPAFSAQVDRQGLRALAASDQVVAISARRRYHPRTAQGLPLMGAWSTRASQGGQGVAIAVVDSGITRDHQAFISPEGTHKVLGGFNVLRHNEDLSDPDGHGTACAGIAAGYDLSQGDFRGGVAPQAMLYGLKVLDGDEGGYDEELSQAFDWCISNQYRSPQAPIMIVTASVGGDQPFHQPCDAFLTVLGSAFSALERAGIAVFAAAGNDGWCDALEDPACHSQVISVGAVYDADLGPTEACLSDLSCLGVLDDNNCEVGYMGRWHQEQRRRDAVINYSDSASFLDLLAPSECATVPGPEVGQYETCFNGTSAATPYAAGAAAVLQARARELRDSFLTVAQLKNLLTSTGDRITDSKSGVSTPRINLERALQKLESGNLD